MEKKIIYLYKNEGSLHATYEEIFSELNFRVVEMTIDELLLQRFNRELLIFIDYNELNFIRSNQKMIHECIIFIDYSAPASKEWLRSLLLLYQQSMNGSQLGSLQNIKYLRQENCKNEEVITPLEKRILSYMEKGCSNRQIAGHLGFKESTIRTYNYVLFQKMHVKNRTQAVLLAKERMII